jgi:Uma2 family endonuclease
MATVSFSTSGPGPVELPLRQFDADEYMAMVGAGVFEERKRVELIGGFIVDMSPANPDHNYVIMRFNELFVPLMPGFKIWIQGTLRVDKQNVFDPDLMLLRPRAESYKRSLPTPADIALVVEVAGSSLRRDTGVKLPIYAQHGVSEYWIADLDREVVVVHRSPTGQAYNSVEEFTGDAELSPLAAPTHRILVRDVFA